MRPEGRALSLGESITPELCAVFVPEGQKSAGGCRCAREAGGIRDAFCSEMVLRRCYAMLQMVGSQRPKVIRPPAEPRWPKERQPVVRRCAHTHKHTQKHKNTQHLPLSKGSTRRSVYIGRGSLKRAQFSSDDDVVATSCLCAQAFPPRHNINIAASNPRDN